jgi:hypothetical protein
MAECGVDLLWHTSCWTCPGERPAAGDPCDPGMNTGDCMYPPVTTCGPGSETTLTCDVTTSSWQEPGTIPCR